MVQSKRLFYKLTDEDEAGRARSGMPMPDRNANAEIRKIMGAWALRQVGAKIRGCLIVSVVLKDDASSEGPTGFEVVLEAPSEAGFDYCDRSLFTMVEGRRDLLHAALARSSKKLPSAQRCRGTRRHRVVPTDAET
jgi:hypothetical protein